MGSSYRDLVVWQASFALVKKIYVLTSKLPKTEVYGLVSQMQRSAISIPSNIAEGQQRGGAKEFKRDSSTSLADQPPNLQPNFSWQRTFTVWNKKNSCLT